MDQNNNNTVTKVPIIQKAAFGSGHLVTNLLPGALGVFSFFLITAFGIDNTAQGDEPKEPKLKKWFKKLVKRN